VQTSAETDTSPRRRGADSDMKRNYVTVRNGWRRAGRQRARQLMDYRRVEIGVSDHATV
jgi:hypothetical protein